MAKFVLTAQLQLQAPKNVAQVVNQIQSQLRGIKVDIDAKGAVEAHREIQKLTKGVDKASDSAKRMGNAFQLSLRRFTALAIATRTVTLFTTTLANSVREAIAFERELVKISQVTGKTMSELRDLTSAITDLSTSFGVASSSLLGVSRILSQAGFDAKQTEIALGTLARTELAPTFDNITETAEGAVAIFNQFRLGAEALEGQLGSINAVAGKFAVEAGDLISVVRRTGGVFKSSGGDLNELIALFTSVRSTTRESAESIATGLRTIFTRIQRPRTIEFLKQFGVELTDLNGKFVGPFEATRRLSEALAGLEQGDISFIKIAEELGGFRQIGKVIPLLQQNRVAQEALNVAQAGSSSLAEDAAKAQATLAVRLAKVQEEFTALIRSISETRSFQIMANTALALAEGIVKVGEAIKPVIPLLAALAAFKLAKGFAGIGGGISRTLQNVQAPQGFARGGMVPGSGNSDSVPAMLTPGEFVIRKSSVAKLGAENLAAMNENRYAKGGTIQPKPGAVGAFFLQPVQGKDREVSLPKNKQGKPQTRAITNIAALNALGYDAGIAGGDLSLPISANAKARAILGANKATDSFRNNYKDKSPAESFKIAQGKLSTSKPGSPEYENAKRFVDAYETPEVQQKLKEATSGTGQDKKSATRAAISGSIQAFYPGKDDVENSAVARKVNIATKKGLSDAVKEAGLKASKNVAGIKPIISLDDQKLIDASDAVAKNTNAVSTTSGYVFEGLIQALTGAKLQGGRATWDFGGGGFNADEQTGLQSLFGKTGFGGLKKADAKLSNTNKSLNSIVSKIASDVNKGNLADYNITPRKMATGGAVGTDTVPALLTPGEFVVNKKSAQAIGYGSLNRMNKIGKYANGGTVTHTAGGTVASNRHFYGSNVRGGLGYPGSMPTQTQEQINSTLAQKQIEKTSKYLAGAGAAAFAVTTALNSMLPAVQENEGAALRLTRALSDSVTTTVGSFGTLGFALSSLGEKFQIGNLIKGKFAGPLVAAGASALLTSSALEALYDSANQYNKAVKEGNLAEAERLSTRASTAGARSTAAVGVGLAAGGGAALAATSSLFGLGPVGAAVAAIGTAAVAATALTYGLEAGADTFQNFLSNFGYATAEQVKAQTASKIATNNFSKALQEASQRAAEAFKDAQRSGDFAGAGERTFGKTAITLVEKGQAARREVNLETEEAFPLQYLPKASIKTNRKIKNEILRRRNAVREFFKNTENLSGSVEEVKSRLEEQVPELKFATSKFFSGVDFSEAIKAIQSQIESTAEAVKESRSFINESFRSSAIAGEVSPVNKTFLQSRDIAQRKLQEEDLGLGRILEQTPEQDRERLLSETRTSLENTVKDSTKALVNNLNSVVQSSDQLSPSLKKLILSLPTQQAVDLARSLTNINSEIKRLQERFKLINFGLNSFNSAATASNTALKNYISSVDGSSTVTERSVNTLQTALSSAGSAVSQEDFDQALQNATKSLEDYGATSKSVEKAQEKLRAGFIAQRAIGNIVGNFQENDIKDLQAVGAPQKAIDQLSVDLNKELTAAGIGDDLKRQIIDDFKNAKVEEALNTAFASGNFEPFKEIVGNLNSEFLKNIDSLKLVIENNKILAKTISDRIKAENDLVDKQKQALSIQLQVAEIQGKYSGNVLTTSDRLANFTKRLNAGARDLNVAPVLGNEQGLEQRIQALRTRSITSQTQLNDENATATARAEAAGLQDRVNKAAKDAIEQAKELISIREREYEVIKKKTDLERRSLDSLIGGDIESFFKQQAAEGALGSLALGRTDLATSFGGDALAESVNYLKELRDAGISEFQGMRIAGAGGLEEQARIAALTARGVNPGLALRGGQVGAETTPALLQAGQQVSKAAETLNKAAELQLDLARDAVIQARDVTINARGIITDSIRNAQEAESRSNPNNNTQQLPANADQNPSKAMMLMQSSVSDFTRTMSLQTDLLKKSTDSLKASVDKLNNGVRMTFDSTNINVNFTGEAILQSLTDRAKAEVLDFVNAKIAAMKPTSQGIEESNSVLPTT